MYHLRTRRLNNSELIQQKKKTEARNRNAIGAKCKKNCNQSSWCQAQENLKPVLLVPSAVKLVTGLTGAKRGKTCNRSYWC